MGSCTSCRTSLHALSEDSVCPSQITSLYANQTWQIRRSVVRGVGWTLIQQRVNLLAGVLLLGLGVCTGACPYFSGLSLMKVSTMAANTKPTIPGAYMPHLHSHLIRMAHWGYVRLPSMCLLSGGSANTRNLSREKRCTLL